MVNINSCNISFKKDAKSVYQSSWLLNNDFRAYRLYSGNYYQNVNFSLRNGLSFDPVSYYIVCQMDKIFKTMPFEFCTRGSDILYRGLYRGIIANDLSDIFNLNPKDNTFIDKAYVSTSKEESVAKKYSGDNGIVLKIKIPGGTKTIDTTMLPIVYSELGDSESEVTLPRNSKFRIDSYNPNTRCAELTYMGQVFPIPTPVRELSDRQDEFCDLENRAAINKSLLNL